MEIKALEQVNKIWSFLNGSPDELNNLSFIGSKEQLLPSVFDISGFASASIAAANLAASELLNIRLEKKVTLQVEVDHLEASAAFRSEALLKPVGWKVPDLWDPIAGDYKAADHWIRLHTNYKNHRQAVLNVLNPTETTRSEIEKLVANYQAQNLEQAVVSQGGCAAVIYEREEWLSTFVGNSTRNEKAVFFEKTGSCKAKFGKLLSTDKPLSGIKILDLTRVIAGPECTRFLAGQGAEVLRIDPPGFEEVPGLLPDTTVGKKCASLDYSTQDGKKIFESLIREAHVLILGLRNGSLDKFGFTLAELRIINPSLIIGLINAYGFESEWKLRRGFDSLVQMSSGIAALGAQKKQVQKPYPLPAQALDHGAGYLLAAGICRALSILYHENNVFNVKSSLVGVANFLFSGPSGDINHVPLKDKDWNSCLFEDQTEWGAVQRVRPPGSINGKRATWLISAGALGRHPAIFA